jgi:hypothetical protein
MRSRVCQDKWVADLAGGVAGFGGGVRVLALSGSGGTFAVEPGACHRSDKDFHQSYR